MTLPPLFNPDILPTWQDQPLTVLGLSLSGEAVARYVAHRGGQVFLSEMGPATEQNRAMKASLEALGVTVETGGHSQRCFTHADCVVVSPGIPPHAPVLEQLRLSGKTIMSEVELAWRESIRPEQTKPLPIIGITGTNGKSTTTALLSHLLSAGGLDAPACGNIGLPLLAVMDERTPQAMPDALVAELSSYQLTFSPTLSARIAVFTNFSPDHLAWHGGLSAYQAAKAALFHQVAPGGWCLLNAHDPVSREIARGVQARCVFYGREEALVAGDEHRLWLDASGVMHASLEGRTYAHILAVKDMRLIGAHNHENMLAAVGAALLMGIQPGTLEAACRSFTGLQHRLAWVADIDGVSFYNDSKATNPEAVIPALRAFTPGSVILLAGGQDKMTDLSDFASVAVAQAGAVWLYGEAAERFDAALRSGGFTRIHRAATLEEATAAALELTRQQPALRAVVLSPACASFDQYRNFEARGEAFEKMVRSLAAQQQPAGGLT
ncbi:MAG: UDP-N-acetylmuramoyl-L-alanine--D-glutamate ligase [Candidatus Melainabacteria bacterium]